MNDDRKFIDWMITRLEEKGPKLDIEDYTVMSSMILKHIYNSFTDTKKEYTKEEQRSLDAAEIVYLLGM